MKIDKSKCVAFTGHRSHKQLTHDRNLFASVLSVDEQLELEISKVIDDGFTTFLSGMAEGFDLLAAECVLRLKSNNPSVRLISVIPFRGQSNKLSYDDKVRYRSVIERCDSTIILSENYFVGCYNVRNDFLIDNSSIIITDFNGTKGGTEYTVKRAIKHSRKVVVIG